MLSTKIIAILFTMSATLIYSEVTNEDKRKPKGATSYATVIIMNDKNEVLLLKRKGTSFANGLYSLPGGKIEDGETALEAAQREALEEIGVQVDDLSLVHVIDRRGGETEFYIFVFKPTVIHGAFSNAEPHKCDDMRWFSCDTLPDMIPAHRQAIGLIQKGILYGAHGY